LDPGKDRVLSVAVAAIDNWSLGMATMRSWIVRQAGVRLNDAMAIHGITPAQSAAGVPEDEVARELGGIISGTVLVGHHVGFDAVMLDQMLKRHLGVHLYNPMIDTASLAMAELDAFRQTGYANQRPPGLEEVCTHCRIPMMERHTAEGDVFTTAELFLLLCARRRKRIGRPLEWRDLPWVKR
jgi:DNA polymerase III subunit epsilon